MLIWFPIFVVWPDWWHFRWQSWSGGVHLLQQCIRTSDCLCCNIIILSVSGWILFLYVYNWVNRLRTSSNTDRKWRFWIFIRTNKIRFNFIGIWSRFKSLAVWLGQSGEERQWCWSGWVFYCWLYNCLRIVWTLPVICISWCCIVSEWADPCCIKNTPLWNLQVSLISS